MSQLTIVARVLVKEEKKDVVQAELLKLIPITRAEKGFIKDSLYY